MYNSVYPQSSFKFYQPRKLILNIPHFQSSISNLPQHLITHISFGSFTDFTSLDPLPPSITHISFKNNTITHLPSLPSTLTHLIVGKVNKNIDSFPPSVTHLYITKFTDINNLPPNLILLECPNNIFITCDLPQTLKSITLPASTTPFLPPGITQLSFSPYFEDFLLLPPNITHLTLAIDSLDQIHSLPKTLLHLSFSSYFNQPLILPEHLQSLEFAEMSNFNHPLHLPATLKKLVLGHEFNHELNLPPNLTHLVIPPGKFKRPILSLPSSLVHFKLSINAIDLEDGILCPLPHLIYCDLYNYHYRNIHGNLFVLPESIQTLILPEKFNHAVSARINPAPNGIKLPQSIIHLTFGQSFNNAVDELSPRLLSLSFGYSFISSIDSLPRTLETLTIGSQIGSCFTRPVDNLPPSLISLTFAFESQFNQPINNLPHSLKELCLGKKFNHPVTQLPPNLQKIQFGINFNHPVNKLPASMRSISFHMQSKFAHSLKSLPPNLHSLAISNYCNQSLAHLPSSLRCLTIHDATGPQPAKQSVLLRLTPKSKFEKSLKHLPLSLVSLDLPIFWDTEMKHLVRPELHFLLDMTNNKWN